MKLSTSITARGLTTAVTIIVAGSMVTFAVLLYFMLVEHYMLAKFELVKVQEDYVRSTLSPSTTIVNYTVANGRCTVRLLNGSTLNLEVGKHVVVGRYVLYCGRDSLHIYYTVVR